MKNGESKYSHQQLMNMADVWDSCAMGCAFDDFKKEDSPLDMRPFEIHGYEFSRHIRFEDWELALKVNAKIRTNMQKHIAGTLEDGDWAG